MTTRREFLSGLAAAGISAQPIFRESAIKSLFRANLIAGDRPPSAIADDESYWAEIQRAFDSDRTMINLNNGGCSPTPSHVLEAMIRDLRFSNELPVEHMWRVLEPRVESVRRDLASEFGCDPEEMAITRNASESNEIMIMGLDLKAGDEVVVTNQNYPRMLTAWDQRARREGIVVKQVSFKVPPPSDDYLVEQFKAAITPRTKVIEVTHITNLTGQIMPVRQIMDLAMPRGIEVFVDGAHAFAHFPFKRDELKADYYGTSLHKWLLAPVGTG
ncbi:MAG TPA: aminotransferase class V-fold PLP-dependent enzyme, partial [Gemmatimonadaceae bacterium]|nr:aminotransferase class V-fold PLP-dependent enzyme [Gemmatimonadaceae bacterium]